MQLRSLDPVASERPAGTHPPATAAPLAPRPGRSLAWVCYRAVRGTWFLVLAHAGALAGVIAGAPLEVWLLLPGFLVLRGLTTTIAYHRYFAHRSFKTSRPFQFVLGCLCCTNLQRGPLWWAAVHRQHHRDADGPGDPHSPVRGGFLWAYAGWMFASLEEPDWGTVRDLRRFPELVWLERLWLVPPLLMAAACWLVGGWALVCVGFCLSAVAGLHGASVVNTLGHLVGSRRYPTRDASRNSFVLALLTFGDGWHNNHHHYPHAARAGFFPGEVDGSFRLIRLLALVGLVWDVREVPPHKLASPVAPPDGPRRGRGSAL